MSKVPWSAHEQRTIQGAMCSLYNIALSRVSSRVLDREKLALVAELMDYWTRSENTAYQRINDHLFKQLEDLRGMLQNEQEMSRDLVEQLVEAEAEVERLRRLVHDTESELDDDSELEFMDRPDVRRQLFPP